MMKFIFLLVTFFSSTLLATPITVTVDRNPVSLNESFQVEFSTTKDPDENPDFKPLAAAFTVMDRNHSSKSSWVNGKGSNEIKWTFTLMATKVGNQVIPALQFGSETSPETAIEIIEPQAQPIKTDKPLFLEVEVDNPQPYLHAQVIFSLRFFYRVQIAEASLGEPEIEHAILEKLTKDKNYTTKIDGVAYSVTERKYALFPQQSGELEIPAMSLTAAVNPNNRYYGSMYGTKREVITSKAIKLQVLPLPVAIANNNHIVSPTVHLKQKWSTDLTELKIGEPITRTLTIMAQAVMGKQLPTLHAADVEISGFKTYPEKAKVHEQKSSAGIVGFREEKIAFIPTIAGSYELPEIKINWFNPHTKQAETSVIPATKLNVLANAIPATNTVAPLPLASNKVDATATSNKNLALDPYKTWQRLTIFFASAWFFTLLFFLTYKRKPVIESEPEIKPYTNINKELKQACFNNDAQTAKTLLLLWGQEHYQAIGLTAISPYCATRLSKEILILNQALYSSNPDVWHGKKLFQTFSEHKAFNKVNKVTVSELEPLHRL